MYIFVKKCYIICGHYNDNTPDHNFTCVYRIVENYPNCNNVILCFIKSCRKKNILTHFCKV